MRYSAFLFLFLLILPLQDIVAQITFSDEILITGQTVGARCVFSADLDGDGDNDVLTTSYDDDKIIWFENTDGQGAFGPHRIISTEVNGAEAVYSIDLDGDGDNDVLSASYLDHKIAWYENTDGQGTFGPQQIIITNADNPKSVFSADLDGDGDNDVLSASLGDVYIAWYENTDGQGTFGPQQIITTYAIGARSVFSTDLDGDGDYDVLSASSYDDKITWYENTDGQGTFGPQQIITTSADEAQSVFSIDLDGDGDNDVLSASEGDDKIAWYENTDGQGTFGPQLVITTSANGAKSVFSADLDGDGDNDVLSASYGDVNIAWYENTDGQGTFGPQQIITNIAYGAEFVFCVDLDGDGDKDVLSASSYDNKIAWYENTDGQGTFGPQLIIPASTDGAESVYSIDLDGDGDNDVLSASCADDKIAWYENTDGLGAFGAQQVITDNADGAWSVYSADLDGDGDNDVLSASYWDSKIAWYENMDGQGTFGSQQIISTNAYDPRSVFSADLDGDGDNDVLSASRNDDKIAWYENTDGLGTFGSEQIITNNADGAYSVYSTDLDGDGDNDVLSASEYDDKIAWYENTDGLGTFGPQRIITTNAYVAKSVYSADLDCDGDNDVLSASHPYQMSERKICWYENEDGQGNFGPQQIINDYVEAYDVFSADLDGDGDNDVIGQSWGGQTLAWYENTDGQGTFGSHQYITNPFTGGDYVHSVFSIDLDGDGDNDVLLASSDNDKIAWYRNEGIPHSISVNLTYQSGSPVPYGGGNLIYDVYIESQLLNPIDFEAWLAVEYEGGPPVTLLMQPLQNIQPGWTLDRTGITYPVPEAWAQGNYMFWGRIGFEPYQVWDESGFPFFKQGVLNDTTLIPFPSPDAPNPFEIGTEKTVEPSTHELLTIHPNPFNPSTVISFTLQVASEVRLSVYDVAGRNVGVRHASPLSGSGTTPTTEYYSAGYHSITFDGSDLPSGIYFVRLEAGEIVQTKKMVLVK